MARHEDHQGERHEPSPFRIGRVTLTVELDEEGNRLFGMNINVADEDGVYEPTKEYDLHAMLGFAMVNLADSEWRDIAYPREQE